jgi:hypothetical protein
VIDEQLDLLYLIRQQDSLQQEQSSFSKAVQRVSYNRPEVGSFTFREQEQV